MDVKSADLSALKIDRNKKNDNYQSQTPKRLIIVLGIVLLAVAGYFIMKNLFTKDPEVQSFTVSMTSSSQTNAVLTASGYVVAQRKAAVASKGTGRLVYLGVVEGDKVRKEKIIARLEDSDIKAQLEQTKANLKVVEAELKDAENTFNRQKTLLKTGAATQVELDAAEARYNRVLASIDVAKAMVNSAEVAMENTLIRAPFDGTVLTKNADVGEIVAPFAASASSKAAVVTIADMTSLEVEVDVSESNIERILMNQECEITLDAYTDRHYPGFVAKIVPTADRSKATVLVKIGFHQYDSRVLPEMSAKVLFLGESGEQTQAESKSYMLIPKTAIIEKENKKFVFGIVNERLKEIEITTGENFGESLEVITGLQTGDKIVSAITPELKNGLKIKILQ